MSLLIADPRAALHTILDTRDEVVAAAHRINVDRAERRWIELDSDESFDAWLIAWGVDSGLAAHDHGGSTAAVQVLRGCLVEWYRDCDDRAAWNVRELAPGRPVTIPSTRIHEIHQSGPETAVSLHVYSPPLRTMRAYPSVHSLGHTDPRPHALDERRIA